MDNNRESKNAFEKTPDVVRVWCDGCYDMTHFGHANSLRQAKALGNEVYVGVHSDIEIAKHKACPPVLTEQERYTMVRAIKWVDHVVENAPYTTAVEILDEYNCDFCAHGDDQSTNAQGEDTYQKVKDARRYQMYKRTQGISTTQLINRMLKFGADLCSSCGDNCKNVAGDNTHKECEGHYLKEGSIGDPNELSYTGNKLPFLATASVLASFAEGIKNAKEGAKIVYAPGTFDLLHPGHLSFLEEAIKEGDYLIVGLYSDETVKRHKGHYPIMNLIERFHSLMAIKNVSDVVLGVPYEISEELLRHFNVQVIARGIKRSHRPVGSLPIEYELNENVIYVEVSSNCDLTTKDLIKRVVNNRKVYEERNASKEKKEASIILQELKKGDGCK